MADTATTPTTTSSPSSDEQWFDIRAEQSERIAFAFLSASLLVGVPLLLLPWWLALPISIIATWKTYKHFLVSVDGGTGLLLVNQFVHVIRKTPSRGASGFYNPDDVKKADQLPRENLRAALQGLYAKFPWERRYKAVDLDVEVKADIEELYASKDGPEVLGKYSYQWRASPSRLSTFVFVSPDVINEGIRDAFSGFFSTEIAGRNAIQAREEIEIIRKKVESLFNEKVHALENKYGIEIVWFAIRDIEYERDFQKARSTRRSMDELNESAKGIVGSDRSIPKKAALDMALMVNGQPVSKNINENTYGVDGMSGEDLGKVLKDIMVSTFGKNGGTDEEAR